MKVLDPTDAPTEVPPSRGVDPDSATAPCAPNRRRWLGLEDRYHVRYEAQFDVTLYGTNNFCSGVVRNLSEGGFFVESKRLLDVGEVCQFDLDLPLATVWCTGTVRWIKPATSTARGGMGLAFEDPSDELLEAIRESLDRRARLAEESHSD